MSRAPLVVLAAVVLLFLAASVFGGDPPAWSDTPRPMAWTDEPPVWSGPKKDRAKPATLWVDTRCAAATLWTDCPREPEPLTVAPRPAMVSATVPGLLPAVPAVAAPMCHYEYRTINGVLTLVRVCTQ